MGLFSYPVKLNWRGCGVSVGISVGVAGGSVGDAEGEGGISVSTTSVGGIVASGGVVDSGWVDGGDSADALQAAKTIPVKITKHLVFIVQSP